MFNAAFLAFVIGVLLHLLFTTTYVTKDVIYAALSVYFLVGILYGITFMLLESAFPGSFALQQLLGDSISYTTFGQDLIYFSFVTLTTSGYGDIVPLSQPAKFLSVLEAISGQIYLTVMIARLIGMHISQLNDPQRKQP
ncbi:MAG: potassium channel family protein [Alphaproteobacteria bacterium]|nr:potassium channel family protein [Alphaproteobacteria bacterium]